MNTSLLPIGVLSLATLLWIVAISFTHTADAVMHETGLAASNVTQTNVNNTTKPAAAVAVAQESGNVTSTVVRDSVFAYLDGKVIPAFDFIHLYDTTPYMIMDGHVAANLPCDGLSQTPLRILVGQAPHMIVAWPDLVPELSRPGQTCMYHADLRSAHEDQQGGSAEGAVITDIAIMNPTPRSIQLPVTSTVVIGVNEIMPLGEGPEGHGIGAEGAGDREEHVQH